MSWFKRRPQARASVGTPEGLTATGVYLDLVNGLKDRIAKVERDKAVLLGLVAVLATGLVASLPLRKVVPFFYEVDSSTGRVSASSRVAQELRVDVARLNLEYQIEGDADIRPLRVFDDGSRTWIQFAGDMALRPAIFVVNNEGTVGSGKSVTLAILMALIHRMRPAIKGVSFEDPVEIESEWMHQRTIARDLHADDDREFRAATAALFRSAVDVFMLGEVRDADAGRVVRAVLESGHSVYTTTHARSALGVFSKYCMPQIGIPIETLATPGMLRLNVYQSLLLRNCPHCSLPPEAHADNLDGQARPTVRPRRCHTTRHRPAVQRWLPTKAIR